MDDIHYMPGFFHLTVGIITDIKSKNGYARLVNSLKPLNIKLKLYGLSLKIVPLPNKTVQVIIVG